MHKNRICCGFCERLMAAVAKAWNLLHHQFLLQTTSDQDMSFVHAYFYFYFSYSSPTAVKSGKRS